MPGLTGTFISLNALAEALVDAVESAVGDAHVQLLDNLAAATPVDTGHAQSNWIASVGAQAGGVVGSKSSVNVSEQSSSKAELASWKLSDGDIHINNNVAYVPKLNEGYSAQAPAGFIEDVVETTLIATFLGRFP